MAQLQVASAMRELAIKKQKEFEATTLDSQEFKDLVRNIESKAEVGEFHYRYVFNGDNPKIVGVFSKELKSKGFTVKNAHGIIGFDVSWEVSAK